MLILEKIIFLQCLILKSVFMDQFKILVGEEVKYEGDNFIHAVAYWTVFKDHLRVGLMQFFINGIPVLHFSNQI